MKAYRRIADTGSIYCLDVEPITGGFHVNGLRNLGVGELPDNAARFHMIEQRGQAGANVCVALIIGPSMAGDSLDWGNAVIGHVKNPRPLLGYLNEYRKSNPETRQAAAPV